MPVTLPRTSRAGDDQENHKRLWDICRCGYRKLPAYSCRYHFLLRRVALLRLVVTRPINAALAVKRTDRSYLGDLVQAAEIVRAVANSMWILGLTNAPIAVIHAMPVATTTGNRVANAAVSSPASRACGAIAVVTTPNVPAPEAAEDHAETPVMGVAAAKRAEAARRTFRRSPPQRVR